MLGQTPKVDASPVNRSGLTRNEQSRAKARALLKEKRTVRDVEDVVPAAATEKKTKMADQTPVETPESSITPLPVAGTPIDATKETAEEAVAPKPVAKNIKRSKQTSMHTLCAPPLRSLFLFSPMVDRDCIPYLLTKIYYGPVILFEIEGFGKTKKLHLVFETAEAALQFRKHVEHNPKVYNFRGRPDREVRIQWDDNPLYSTAVPTVDSAMVDTRTILFSSNCRDMEELERRVHGHKDLLLVPKFYKLEEEDRGEMRTNFRDRASADAFIHNLTSFMEREHSIEIKTLPDWQPEVDTTPNPLTLAEFFEGRARRKNKRRGKVTSPKSVKQRPEAQSMDTPFLGTDATGTVAPSGEVNLERKGGRWQEAAPPVDSLRTQQQPEVDSVVKSDQEVREPDVADVQPVEPMAPAVKADNESIEVELMVAPAPMSQPESSCKEETLESSIVDPLPVQADAAEANAVDTPNCIELAPALLSKSSPRSSCNQETRSNSQPVESDAAEANAVDTTSDFEPVVASAVSTSQPEVCCNQETCESTLLDSQPFEDSATGSKAVELANDVEDLEAPVPATLLTSSCDQETIASDVVTIEPINMSAVEVDIALNEVEVATAISSAPPDPGCGQEPLAKTVADCGAVSEEAPEAEATSIEVIVPASVDSSVLLDSGRNAKSLEIEDAEPRQVVLQAEVSHSEEDPDQTKLPATSVSPNSESGCLQDKDESVIIDMSGPPVLKDDCVVQDSQTDELTGHADALDTQDTATIVPSLKPKRSFVLEQKSIASPEISTTVALSDPDNALPTFAEHRRVLSSEFEPSTSPSDQPDTIQETEEGDAIQSIDESAPLSSSPASCCAS